VKTIEFLFPEVANLYGDPFNVRYLAKSIEISEPVNVIETALTEEPFFVKGDVDLIYMGSMSERSQEIVIETLLPYKERLEELIEAGTVMLFTGNAMEILGDSIEEFQENAASGTEKSVKKISALGIAGLSAKRNMQTRFNTLFHGTLEGDDKAMPILGHKAVFSFSYGDNEKCAAFRSVKGCGINKESVFEGWRKKNAFATYLIGPLLVMNPEFTCYLIEKMGGKNAEAAFQKSAKECFDIRMKEFEDDNTNYLQ